MVCKAVFDGARNPFRPLAGLTERNRLARAGHTFLVQKYYLDFLYEKVIVYGIGHPIANAMYWINHQVQFHFVLRTDRTETDMNTPRKRPKGALRAEAARFRGDPEKL